MKSRLLRLIILVDVSAFTSATITVLLKMPYKYNLSTENIAELVSLVTHILMHEIVQRLLLDNNLPHFMTFFLNTYSTEIRGASTIPLSDITERGKSTDDIVLSREIRTQIIKAFAGTALKVEDITSIHSELGTVIHWLQSPEYQMQVCACLFLGNLACNPGHFGKEVARLPGLGKSLAQCLRTARHNDVLTSAFDLLQNLAVDLGNRDKLGEAGIFQSLARCWLPTAVDLQSSRRALYHTRQLIRGSFPNVYRVLRKQEIGTPSSLGSRPWIYQLVLVFENSEDPISKAEVGRIFAEVWRTLNNSPQSHELLEHTATPLLDMINENISDGISQHRYLPRLIAQEIRESFLDEGRSRLLEPILGLIQSSNESLVTEGWLVLSLMAMWGEGAVAIYEKLCMDSQSNFQCVLEATKAPESRPGTNANARYLVAQLAKQFVSPLNVR